MSDNQKSATEQKGLCLGPPPPPVTNTINIGKDVDYSPPAMMVTISAARGEAAPMGPPPPPATQPPPRQW